MLPTDDATTPRLDDLLDAWRAGPAEASVFIEEDGRTFTIAAFEALVARTGAWLDANGIGADDRVAVWLVNRIEWLALLFALARRGAILVAVNTRYRSAELRHILASSGARLLIMQTDFRAIEFPAVIAGLDPDTVPELETVAILGGSKDRTAILKRRTIAFAPEVYERPPLGPDTASDAEAPLILFTTSGTTRAPKLVTHAQRTIALHSRRAAKAFGFDAPGARFLATMPFCGVFGLNSVLAAVAGGAPVHMVSMFEVEGTARRVAEHRITHLFGSDEMFRRLIEHGIEALASTWCCGFAAFTPGLGAVLQTAAEKGLPLAGLYGSSEVNALFSMQPHDLPLEERLRAGGFPASAEAKVRIRDKETGTLLGPYETGEIEIRAPTSFIGYFRNPDATKAAFDAEGFFRTGDIGYRRDDGSFVYLARSGDALRLSGFLVDPAEIEDALKTLQGIGDAQVVGIEFGGQTRAIAFVTPDGDFEEGEARAAAAEMLAAFKVPVRILEIEAFPTTESANGLKIQKAKLRQLALDKLTEG